MKHLTVCAASAQFLPRKCTLADVARKRIMSNREVLEEFIEIYKNESCLWNIKNKDYHNRDKRNAAYCKLIEKLKEIEPNTDRDLVTKKINSFRTAFKKEEHKVMEYLKSGAGVDDMYKPKLWYYNQLYFLKEQGIPRSSRSNLSDHVGFEMLRTPTEPSDAEPTEHTESDSTVTPPTETIESSDEQTVRSNISANNRPPSRPPKKKADSIVSDVLLSVQNHFKRPAINEDRYDVFAKSIAIKMRELSKNQRLIAEKIINDTLFVPEMGNLTLTHKLCNHNHTQQFTFDPSPINWSTSSSSSNHTYLSSPPIPPVPATNSTQPIVITQIQPLEVEEQIHNGSQQLGQSVSLLSVPEVNAATYFNNFQM